MKIVCLSDTHTKHNEVVMPQGDVLVYAGDYTSVGRPEEHESFREWLLRQEFDYKVVIAGNHDFWAPTEPQCWGDGVYYLFDSGVTIGGLRFWGSPFTPKFGDWAFMYPRYENRWTIIPEETDVLVTHGPPLGGQDQAYPNGPNLGCAALLRETSIRVHPKLHVFGHIHGGYGMEELNDYTLANASAMDEQYNLVNSPIVVEV